MRQSSGNITSDLAVNEFYNIYPFLLNKINHLLLVFSSFTTKSSTGPNGLCLTKFTTSLQSLFEVLEKERNGLQSQLLHVNPAVNKGQRNLREKSWGGWRLHKNSTIISFSFHCCPPLSLSQPSPAQDRVSLCNPMQSQTQILPCFGF